MATVYKTPGVYVEEIPKFPPSVAQVETAIPAFIGYTERADRLSPGDLLNVPTRIGSLVDYELYFGGAAEPNITEVLLDDNGNFVSAAFTENFFMYNALRLFYANGGGDCYIVSVGLYAGGAPTQGAYTDPGVGLEAIAPIDEPTILLFPDAVLLGGTNLYDVQKKALQQCEALMDRVAVLDLLATDPNGVDFRNNIGVNALKYGAAYTPWLRVDLPKGIGYRDVSTVIRRGGIVVPLSSLTTEPAVLTTITDLDNVVGDANTVNTALDALNGAQPSLRARFDELVAAYQAGPTVALFQDIIRFLYDIALNVNTLASAGGLQDTALQNTVLGSIVPEFRPQYTTIVSIEQDALAQIAGYVSLFGAPPYSTAAWLTPQWDNSFLTPPGVGGFMGGTDDPTRMNSVLDNLTDAFNLINQAYLRNVVNAAATRETALNAGLREQFPLFKSILAGIDATESNLPPSGAVAGVYAYVDRTRGVWKAPANVSLNEVVAPAHIFTASELDNLNVHSSGKSINAIRAFTGRGTLIFGARTLAGNDNEWRYVSVRRTFNMVEESVKKASEQFVFEPNDANTWIKLQAMIENFLFGIWRQGGLQGIKPEHAFYVAVGLGKTMTALDILEGRLIVEIGMAAVRPAEFIVLKFSHKMAES